MGPLGRKVCFLPPPHQKASFHHRLIYEPLGFPLKFRVFLASPLENKCFCCSCSSPKHHQTWVIQAIVICWCATKGCVCFNWRCFCQNLLRCNRGRTVELKNKYTSLTGNSGSFTLQVGGSVVESFINTYKVLLLLNCHYIHLCPSIKSLQ